MAKRTAAQKAAIHEYRKVRRRVLSNEARVADVYNTVLAGEERKYLGAAVIPGSDISGTAVDIKRRTRELLEYERKQRQEIQRGKNVRYWEYDFAPHLKQYEKERDAVASMLANLQNAYGELLYIEGFKYIDPGFAIPIPNLSTIPDIRRSTEILHDYRHKIMQERGRAQNLMNKKYNDWAAFRSRINMFNTEADKVMNAYPGQIMTDNVGGKERKWRISGNYAKMLNYHGNWWKRLNDVLDRFNKTQKQMFITVAQPYLEPVFDNAKDYLWGYESFAVSIPAWVAAIERVFRDIAGKATLTETGFSDFLQYTREFIGFMDINSDIFEKDITVEMYE